ncbi:hypothetical protein [Streptomyces cadmiisoli]|nr:hypothetical protein [Streptomyces cadmiisoli]
MRSRHARAVAAMALVLVLASCTSDGSQESGDSGALLGPVPAEPAAQPPRSAVTAAQNLAHELDFDHVKDLTAVFDERGSNGNCRLSYAMLTPMSHAVAYTRSEDVLGGDGNGIDVLLYADAGKARSAADWWRNCGRDLTPDVVTYGNFVVVGDYIGPQARSIRIETTLVDLYGPE